MPSRPRALPPALPRPVFTRAEAVALGVSAQSLKRRQIMRVAPSIYAVAGCPIAERHVIAALCRADQDAVACGPSAARLWEVPLPRPLQRWEIGDAVHIATSQRGGRRGAPIIHHVRSLHSADVTRSGDIRALSSSRLFIEMALFLDHDDLVAAGDALIRVPRPGLEGRSDPWTEIDVIAEAVARYRGRGRRRCLDALRDLRVGSDSAPETWLRLAAVRAGLPEPLPNVPIIHGGRPLGTPDLQWPAWRVCLEHEGAHHLTPQQLERDIARAERRHRAGWIEVRTVAGDLARGCRTAIIRVREALVRQGWRPSAR